MTIETFVLVLDDFEITGDSLLAARGSAVMCEAAAVDSDIGELSPFPAERILTESGKIAKQPRSAAGSRLTSSGALWRKKLIHEPGGQVARDTRGVVPAMHLAEDQRAFDQDAVQVCERFRIFRAASSRKISEHVASRPLVRRGSLVDRIIRIRKLRCGVDEHASAKIGRVEPLIEHIEQSQQLRARIVT